MLGSDRPELLFIPGFAQCAQSWSPILCKVAGGYRSAALDFTHAALDERIAELAAAARAADAVIGYSLGGRLALHARLRGEIAPRALVLVGVSAGYENEQERAARRAADEELAAWIEAHSIEEFVERWERSPVFATQSPELVAAQRAGRLSHSPAELALTLRTAGQGALAPVWDRLGEVTEPVLAMAGERDARYAEAAERIASLVPRGRAALVPGAGHAPQLERPDEFAALLCDFLDEVL